MPNTSARRSPFLISLALLVLSAPLAAQRVPGEWRHLGPDGGSIVDLVSVPGSPRTLYASVGGTVYRSEDGGASWTSTLLGDVLSTVYSLAVDAVDPSTVYAAQMEVLRSLDGGRTWVPVGPFPGVYDIAGHPRIAGTLYAATTRGLYQSSDGGASWKHIRHNGLPETYRAILVVVSPAGELYVAFEDYATGRYRLFRSLDGGASWRPADGGPLQGQRVLAVAADPRSSQLLYAGTYESLYRSRDGGESWDKIGPPGSGPQGSAQATSLAVDPVRGYLYAGTYRGLFRYQEAEDAWTQLHGLPEWGFVTAILPLSPDNVLAGVYTSVRRGGVFRSSDFGASWSFISQGISGLTVTSIAVGAPGTLWIVAHGVLFKSTDRGLTWNRIQPDPPSSTYPRQVVVDPLDRSNVFVEMSDGEIRRSHDAGETWEVGGNPDVDALEIVIDPQTPSTLYAAGHRGVAKSTDRGNTWARLPTGTGSVYDIAISPSSPTTLYAIAGYSLLRTTDGGAAWTRVSPRSKIPPNVVAVDPRVPTTVYTATGGVFHKSSNGGKTWKRFGNAFKNKLVYSMEAAPSGLLYAAVWYKNVHSIGEGDAVWDALGDAGRWSFTELAFDPHDPCRVYAGALAQGLLVFTLAGTAECPAEP